MQQQPKRRSWEDLRKPKIATTHTDIDKALLETFESASGKKVIQWLWEQNVINSLPVDASESAWREHEGKRRLVRSLVEKLEGLKLDRPNNKSE